MTAKQSKSGTKAPNEGDGLLSNAQYSTDTAFTRRHQPSRTYLWAILWSIFGLAILLSIAIVVIASFRRARANQTVIPLASIPSHQLRLLNEKITKAHRGCESTVLLIRHCEKFGPDTVSREEEDEYIPEEDRLAEEEEKVDHCSYLGMERAHFFASLFGSTTSSSNSTQPPPRYPLPTELYALSKDRGNHNNWREMETLEPVASKASIPIDMRFGHADRDALANDVFERLANGDMCGKLAVISWKHSFLPALARALACPDCPAAYPENTFDEMWQLKYVFDPHALYDKVSGGDTATVGVTMDIVEADNGTGSVRRRELARKKHRRRWAVYSTIVHQNFDPLAYSFQTGDYPPTGAKRGGSWVTNDDL
jgi:hypothetical protein